jgi:hypothetical protein
MKKTVFLTEMLGLLLVAGCFQDPGPDGKNGQNYGWGDPFNGLQLGIQVNTNIFAASDPILVQLAFRSTSSSNVMFWESGIWPNTVIDVTNQLEPIKMTAEGMRRRNIFSPGGSRDRNKLVTLKPGGVYLLDPIDLRPLFIVETNTVCLITAYYEERMDQGWKGKLVSNRLLVEFR